MRRRALLIFILCAAALVGWALWSLGDRASQPQSHVEQAGRAAIGGPFTLMGQFGRVRTDKDFAGHYMLVYFGYTNCPDVCPTTLSVVADALEKLAGARQQVVPIFITVDPARDTPAQLKAYLASFGPDFVGLTGSDDAIAKVAREYHVYYKAHAPGKDGQYAVDHSNWLYLMGPDGKFIANFDETMGPDKLAAAIASHLS